MLPGKVPPEVLKKIVFNLLGVQDERVIVKSGVGIDAAAIDFGEKVLVASSDPITGAEKRIGFYAINVNANDVATFGAKPRWFLATILLPENANESLLKEIMEDMHKSAEKLGISIVGGHTEVTIGLNRPIVIGTMLGEVEKEKLVRSNGSRAGDVMILTKGVGIEGTSIIASEKEEELREVFGDELIESAKRFLEKISVVKEALIATEIGVHAMHDPTEGGIANGFHEMADAAGLGFRVYYDRIPIAEETKKLCEYFNLDPLALISSGSLLIAAPPERAEEIVKAIRKEGIEAAIVGEFLEDKNVKVIVREGKETPLKRPETDEIWKLF